MTWPAFLDTALLTAEVFERQVPGIELSETGTGYAGSVSVSVIPSWLKGYES